IRSTTASSRRRSLPVSLSARVKVTFTMLASLPDRYGKQGSVGLALPLRASGIAAGASQETIEVIGEALPVALIEWRRAPEDIAGGPQLLHEIAHGEALSDVVLRIQLASRVERVSSAPDHLGGQGYVGGDHQVAGLDLLDDRLVGDVEALRHADGLDERGWRHAKQRVGDQRRQDLRPLGGPEDDLLDDQRARIGIDPDLHSADSTPSEFLLTTRATTLIMRPGQRRPALRQERILALQPGVPHPIARVLEAVTDPQHGGCRWPASEDFDPRRSSSCE